MTLHENPPGRSAPGGFEAANRMSVNQPLQERVP
jgi:hypothetical protein